MNLKVNLRFVGALALKAGNNKVKFELPSSTTLGEAVKQVFKTYKLGSIEGSEKGISAGYLRVFLNGRMKPMNTVLKEDDEISFLPPMAGG